MCILHVHIYYACVVITCACTYVYKKISSVCNICTYVSATKEDTQGKQCNVQYIYV